MVHAMFGVVTFLQYCNIYYHMCLEETKVYMQCIE